MSTFLRDLIQAPDGSWFILSLGFRQIHIWMAFHHLGREVFLTPLRFEKDGWLYCGNDGTVEESYDINVPGEQVRKTEYTFQNTDWHIDWCALRKPDWTNYAFHDDHLVLRGGKDTLNDKGSPTFLALRQKAFDMDYAVTVTNGSGHSAGGVTVYGTEGEHYDLFLRRTDTDCEAVLMLNIGGIHHEQAVLPLTGSTAEFIIRSDSVNYRFFVRSGDEDIYMGTAQSKFLSNEVSTHFTGAVLALFAQGEGESCFEKLKIVYSFPAA